MLTVKWNIYSRFALTSEGEETEVCFGSDANEFFCLRSVCYPVPSGVYLWDRDRQVPPYRHSRHWGQSRNWQRQNTLKKLWPSSTSTTRSMPWWCFSSQTMPGWLWPSDFVFWSCLGTFTSHCNPTLHLPLITPGERFTSQETPCEFSRSS